MCYNGLRLTLWHARQVGAPCFAPHESVLLKNQVFHRYDWVLGKFLPTCLSPSVKCVTPYSSSYFAIFVKSRYMSVGMVLNIRDKAVNQHGKVQPSFNNTCNRQLHVWYIYPQSWITISQCFFELDIGKMGEGGKARSRSEDRKKI